jgi:hypothetical protein
MRCWALAFTVVAMLAGSSLCLAQPAPSSALAKELVGLLDQHKLQSVAARLPGNQNRFVAVLYVPNSELLTVSAAYTVPVLLQEQIYQHKYRDAYLALNRGGAQAGKLLIEDVGADGLAAAAPPGGSIDLIYQEITNKTLLNGDWKSQKLSEQEYKQRFETASSAYVQALTALIDQLKRTP